MITDGRYTLVYPTGDYRTMEVKTLKKGNLAGRTILKIKEGHDFNGIGFLVNDAPRFWKKFAAANPEVRLERIRKAVERIAADPEAAGLAYAMKENCCYRCGRELTVPASIHKGMGPECAKKNWNRDDQKAAYAWRKGQAKVPTFSARLVKSDEDWAKQKNLFAEEERKQEEKAFMSDPDLHRNWGGEFEKQRCGICGVPRYRCSC